MSRGAIEEIAEPQIMELFEKGKTCIRKNKERKEKIDTLEFQIKQYKDKVERLEMELKKSA